MNIQSLLSDKISQALQISGGPAQADPLVKQSSKAQFGDYQVNGVMAIARIRGIPPRLLAERIVAIIDEQQLLEGIVEKIEIAGPGFINLFLNEKWLAQYAVAMFNSPRLNISDVTPQTIVVDYSAPNVAKEMHVGHLRSTIIGDAVVRTLEFIGHNVIRANHIGDWGTQFGMLIAYLEKIENDDAHKMELADLEAFYREAKLHYDSDEEFAKRARSYVVKLQRGDEYCRAMWQKLVKITMTQNSETYRRLNVTLTDNDIMGESLYNPMLPGVVAGLKVRGLATKSDGATVVYLDEFTNKNGDPMGVIVQKSDGGYLYTTTDIACAKYRYEKLNADRILYYTDSRQHQHLMQAWSIVRKAGYVPETVSLEHHMFGMMLGKDGKPFKTRSGGTIKLTDLLDEAIVRTKKIVDQKSGDLSEEERNHIVNAVAIGAVKYADLSKNRTTDYIFDWDNMLSLEGNTAPYLQYAYARIMSIFKKANLAAETLNAAIQITHPRERALINRLTQFEETLDMVAKEGTPHLMCSYLYDVAGLFSGFYQDCPILTNDDACITQSRLALAALTARVLKQGLTLLGIETIERM